MKNTDNSQLRRLQTLGQAFNKNRIVSPEEMEAILEAIVGALATFKKENQDLNNDTKNIVENYFEIAEKEYNKILDLFENKHYKVSSEINEKINLVKNLIEEFKAVKPKDGENGKDGVAPTIEEIVPEVLKQIEIPEPEKFELNSEELINKINEAEGENKIDASKIKNLPIPKSIGGRGIVEAPKDSKIYGRKNREWVEVEGAGEHNHDDLYYQKSEVDNKIADLVDSSPATLNTLNELASALGDDPNFATTIATQIGNKEDTVNKTTAIAGNETSNVKFPTVKAIYDWATGLFATISSLNSHISNTSNPHYVTKSQVGLGNVDNTSDVNKPISTATQTALNLKADDSNVVHKTGDETVGGSKTWSATQYFSNGISSVFGLFSSGNGAGSNTSKQLQFGFNGTDGYSHYITTEHNSANILNKIKFWLNTSGTANGSSAPNVGNENVLELSNSEVVANKNLVSKGIEVNINRPKSDQRRLVFSNSTDAHQKIIYQPAGTNDIAIYSTETLTNDFKIDANGDIIIKGGTQNITNAWTNYTPTLSGASGSGGTFDFGDAYYKIIGKTCSFRLRMRITSKGTLSGNVYISLPIATSAVIEQTLAGGIFASASISSRGLPVAVGNAILFISAAGAAALDWSSAAVNDWVYVSGSYEII